MFISFIFSNTVCSIMEFVINQGEIFPFLPWVEYSLINPTPER